MSLLMDDFTLNQRMGGKHITANQRSYINEAKSGLFIKST